MESKMVILVVEDDFATRNSMVHSLQSLGYGKLFTAKNSQEAMDIIAKEDLDLALLDVGLAKSELDGISLAKAINRKCPEMKLIFTTSFSDKATLERSSEVAHQNFLIKPVGNEQLSVSIQKAFSKEEPIPSFAAPNQCPFSVVKEHVYIKSKNDKYYYKVGIQDILYLETTNKGVEFFTQTQKFFTYTSLTETLSKINHPSIIQIHKRYAVNTFAIKGKSESDILLISGKEIPIGRSFKTEKLEALFTRI